MPLSNGFPFTGVVEQSPKPGQSLLYFVGICTFVLVAFCEHRGRSGRDCPDVPQILFNFFLYMTTFLSIPCNEVRPVMEFQPIKCVWK